MLDLDAGVHLVEIERAVFVKKLEGAGATVTDAQARLDADPADLFALGVGDAGGGCFLDHLLMAALFSFAVDLRSEEHTSELQSLMRISYAVFCLNKKNTETSTSRITNNRDQSYH